MLRRPTSSSAAFLISAIALFAAIGADSAWGLEATSQENPNVPCAILKDYEGDVQVLDASRLTLVNTSRNAAIPCGGWVSISRGWAKLKHRDGHWFRLGQNSFVGVPESNLLGEKQGDHLVLYRGVIWVDADAGAGELRVITTNGRARVKDASAIIVFNPDQQNTQLIALDHQAVFENRFETSRSVTVHGGEASSLNFWLLRVVPSQPAAVSTASLHELFSLIPLTELEKAHAVAVARERQDRKFASQLTPNPDEPERKPAAEGRSYTAIEESGPKSHNYLRHPVNSAEKAKIRKKWVNRMTAGEPVGERILFPDKFYGHPQKVQVQVDDPAAAFEKKQRRSEDAEKKRLLDELSQIRED